MQFRQVRDLAVELLTVHGLRDWSFAFNWRKRSMGLCVFPHRRIELSVYFVERNDHAEILDTILHEIAHALVGSEHGHDEVWKRKCLEIGARPERCSDAEMPEGKWRASCQGCGNVFQRHRRPKRTRGWFCQVCGPDQGGLIWSRD
jgi:predicted SprT family Zn-dependent metalloprotease